MHKKRKYTILLGIIGFILVAVFLIELTISGKSVEQIIGTNSTSRLVGSLGILLMIIAVLIENYELKKIKKRKGF